MNSYTYVSKCNSLNNIPIGQYCNFKKPDKIATYFIPRFTIQLDIKFKCRKKVSKIFPNKAMHSLLFLSSLASNFLFFLSFSCYYRLSGSKYLISPRHFQWQLISVVKKSSCTELSEDLQTNDNRSGFKRAFYLFFFPPIVNST